MMGYPTQGLNNVVIEQDLGNKVTTNDIYSRIAGHFIDRIALDYTNLDPSLCPLGKSDLIPFEAFGYLVVGIHDGCSKQNPNYRSTSDTPDTLSTQYLTSVTKLVLATILELDKLNQ